MLVITRKIGEQIRVGDIVITVITSSKGRATIGIDAPREIAIVRGELEPRQAATPPVSDSASQPASPTPTEQPS